MKADNYTQHIESFDSFFRQAVSAIDTGDAEGLKKILETHPELVGERLRSPGIWLRDQIGNALNGFFKDPYLLWFVSEDAVRNRSLPANIATIAHIIIQKAKEEKTTSMQDQLDYTLKLVAWSWVARECSVQIGLMDVLIDAGAAVDGIPNNALVCSNFDAAEHAIKRGAPLTLPAALCLGRWEDADNLASTANAGQKQFSLVLAALNGKAEAVERAISYGVDINKPSEQLYSHATPLHHAVWSGSLDAVKVLMEAGAKTDTKDTVYNGTPLGWAEYGKQEKIANYLREKGVKH